MARHTNGASLEDCHTNFFALTELCGIKWRKLIWGGGSSSTDPLEDPVLSSYSRCLAGDVLCVWRRVATPQNPQPPQSDQTQVPPPPLPPPPPPPLSLHAAKELWIFWYGEEPDLGGLIAPELIASECEQGSWESGLSYECRSLLFKALHNLIERCLLSRDFVRLGKWFVQPYDGDEEDIAKSCWHLSFSFAFFVHGESTVCASVDVRQHPPVRRLSRIRPGNQQTKVILSPFGLTGSLANSTNNTCNGNSSATDTGSTRLLNAWRHFYPIANSNGTESGTVEVIVGGVRMRYPARYVLFTEMDNEESPVSKDSSPHASRYLPPRTSAALSHRTLTDLGISQQDSEIVGGNDANVDIKPTKEWEFVDPTRRNNCTCSKCTNNITDQGTPGGGSPGSCGGLSPLPPASAGGPASCGVSTTLPSSPPPPLMAPPTPRNATAPLLLPHTPAATPPLLHPPNTPRALYNQGSPESPVECLKRPILALQEPEPDPMEEERPLDLLYDYSTLHAWLDHPIKKFKQEEGHAVSVGISGEAGANLWGGWDEPSWRKNEDLYAGHNHTKMAPVEPQPFNGPIQTFIKSEIKQEPNQDDSNKESKNLYTFDGLRVSYKDLDQIFDNSDDASGDETVRLLQVHTPPDSNKSNGGCGGEETGMNTTLSSIGNTARTNNRTCGVRPEEFKMFPTPPSLEHNPQPSPGAFTLPEPDHLPSLNLRCGSPPDEPIDDWSYVFKPPTICKYVGSSKYAALAGLSNTVPPSNCIYRPSWQQQTAAPEPRVSQRPPASRTPHMSNLHSVGTISQPASVGGVSGIGSAPPPPLVPTPSPPSSPPSSAPACALLLNILLADTALNIFRDHNFDSCTMCVCNAGPKVVGNIRGAECGIYLSGSAGSPASPDSNLGIPSPIPTLGGNGLLEEEPIRCSCGFSAVVNRRLAHRSGLFYEDEIEITGIAEDPAVYKKDGGAFSDPNKNCAAALIELIREQCGVIGNPASSLYLAAAEASESSNNPEPQIHLLEYSDCGEAAALALEAAAGRSVSIVHSWPFLRAPAPTCGRDVVRVMRRLQPLLQDAIQKKCSTRMWDAVAGPLTWRQFHRLAGRGTEDLCEPQPVPTLLVGYDRDWISLSPHAIHHWDKLLLEPYSYSRDVGYIVLVPDNAVLISKVQAFFRDLSAAYEQCRLGRHAPVARISKDGLYRVPYTSRSEPLDEWYNGLPENTSTEILKLYAQICRGILAPALSNVQLDRTLLNGEGSGVSRPPPPSTTPTERPAPSPMAPPSTPDHPPTPTAQHSDHEVDGGNSNANSNTSTGSCISENSSNDDDEGSAPCIVIYLIEPCLGGDRRSACLAMLRSAASLLQILPDHIRPNVTVQMISAESISDIGAASGMGTPAIRGIRRSAHLRSLALSIFSQCRRQLAHTTNIKSLTGFGTAANADTFLKNKDEKNRMPYRLYAPPYVLAPPRPLKDIAETFGQAASEPCSILYLSYCLSADQSWLLAAATDGRGEILETCTINVDVPGRSRRRRVPPARRLGLTKLMDFTLGVMSQSVQPWRLVVGRIGRIGHGELKGWSWLLSRKNLLKASTQLREVCASCGLMYPGGAPCILSACLVSTEPDSALRLMADQFTPDERFSQAAVASQLSTPQDVTCTHILVFPTSATTQSSQTAFQEQHINEPELGDEELFSALNDDDMPDGIESMNDFNDIFNLNGWSPKREGEGTSRPGSPSRPATTLGRHSPLSEDDNTKCGGSGSWEEVGALLQQPLALGYLVSTAPLGRMPRWWWSACPHAASACPAFLKNALHLHSPAVQQQSDDLLPPPTSPQHPLDSHFTTDVLRYVLEGYNALSWLALDCNTQDRLSCLPSHVQVLMQLYHLTYALV